MGNDFKKSVWQAAKADISAQEKLWGRNQRIGHGPCPSMVDIGGFLDGTMSAKPARKAMEAHLAECAVCRGDIVDLYLLLRAPAFSVPSDLMQRLLNLCPGGDEPRPAAS